MLHGRRATAQARDAVQLSQAWRRVMLHGRRATFQAPDAVQLFQAWRRVMLHGRRATARWFLARLAPRDPVHIHFGSARGRSISTEVVAMRSPFPIATFLTLVFTTACGAPEGDGGDGGEEGSADAVAEAQRGVGSVSFPTSCSDAVQPAFEEALAALHSFWFAEAEEGFRQVSETDPECAMAHWGVAMTLWGNPMTRAAPPDPRIESALASIENARALSDQATERERMYIEAAAALYEGHPQVGHIERMRAHEQAMREVMEAHPDDPEAAIFYGRIVVGNAPPDDLTFARQLHAAEIMEPLFESQADHPGLAHYLIHAYDAPAVAERGLGAASQYADIAPDAPHALHMPTHIFTRVGYWEESIELNARSAQAEPNPDAAVHPLDYMVYAHLQLGQDDAAGDVLARARDVPDEYYGGLIGYNFAAMQARYALERSAWSEAAELAVPGEALPYVTAVTHFARALGSARSGDAEAGRREVDALTRLRDDLRAGGEDYWATVVEAQRLAAAAWVAHAEGDDDQALDLARQGAELEGTVQKHPVTPGPLLPARELLGDLLMELDRPAEAQQAYEATLGQERNRARALYGGARAAEAAGDLEAANRHYGALLALLEHADPDRPDLIAARAWSERG
jgi:tetratricopeptide (TPR) repeat protein